MIIEVLKKRGNPQAYGKRSSIVKQEDKYETITELRVKNGFIIELLCKTLEIARSSYCK